MTRNFTLLLLLAGLVIAQSTPRSKPPACGFGGSIHNCHCSERTDAIRQKIFTSCASKNEKEQTACLKLENRDHCSLAETITKWDGEDVAWSQDASGEYQAKSPLGPMCSMACKPHHCGCTEEYCHFGESQDQIDADSEESAKNGTES